MRDDYRARMQQGTTNSSGLFISFLSPGYIAQLGGQPFDLVRAMIQ